MSTKNRSTPVVEKKEEKCSCDCTKCDCGCGCPCGCCGEGKAILLYGTIFVSALLIAGSVFFKPCCKMPEIRMPKHPPVPSMQKIEEIARTAVSQQIDEATKNVIRNNPEVLVETLNKFYKEQEAKAAKAAKDGARRAEPREFKLENLPKADEALVQKIIDDKTNYSLGNKDGKFVIIEFFDYRCGWCKRTNKGLEEAIAKPEGKNIRWIPIDTPIFGDGSELIARYVLAAGEQGKYAEMHAAVGGASGQLDEAALLELAKGIKLDTAKLTADANGDKIKAKLESNNEFREKLNINGVPMVIVDGRINGGALIGDALDTVVKISSQR